MKRLLFVLPFFLLVLAAAGSPLTAQSGSERLKKDRNLIVQEEVLQSGSQNAYDLVRTLRPQWLRTRGTQSLHRGEDIAVYVDGVRYGRQEELRAMPVSEVGSLQFLDAASATQRFGTGHSHGAILVTRRSTT